MERYGHPTPVTTTMVIKKYQCTNEYMLIDIYHKLQLLK